MSDWQPIETAPKDGQFIAFARGASGSPMDVFYGVAEWVEKKSGGFVEGWFWNYAIRPTHWMPLPEPPILLSQEEAFQRAVKAGMWNGLVSKPEDA